MKYRYPHIYRPRSSSVPPSGVPLSLRPSSRARSVTPAPPHIRDIIEEEPVSRKPVYTYTGLKLSDEFDLEMTRAMSSSEHQSSVRRRTSYRPLKSTKINSELIHAYMAHRDAYNWPGEPLYHRPYVGSYVRRPLQELLEPSVHLPRSRITRDPWWWDYPSLRPYSPYSRYPYSSYYPYTSYRYPLASSWRSPYYLRDSYLSPVKRTYLWSYHPVRPFSYNYYWI